MASGNCGDCGNNNPNPLDPCNRVACDNPCGRTGPDNTAACETLPSQIDNFTLQFFGEVVKTEVDGKVVWSLPCSLDTGLPANPRGTNEPLGCYILRLFEDGILGDQGPEGEPGEPGTDGNNAYTTVAAPFATPSLEHPYVQFVLVNNASIVTGANLFVENSGWYNVVGVDGTGVVFANLIQKLSDAVDIVPVGAVVVPAGQTGVGVKGPTGDKGLSGDVGQQGPKGLPGDDAVVPTQTNGFFHTTAGQDFAITGESWVPVYFDPGSPPATALDPVIQLPNAGTYLIVGKTAATTQATVYVKLYNNTTFADIPGSEQKISASVSNEFRHCPFAVTYVATGPEEIQLYTKGSVGFGDGQAGADNAVRCIKIDSNGRILIGGTFTHVNGNATYRKLCRLMPDGTIDTTFNPGAGSSSGCNGSVSGTVSVEDIGILSDGRIVIVGDFVTYRDSAGIQTVNHFAILNADGTLITAMHAAPAPSTGITYTLAVQDPAGGREDVIVGGSFTTCRGVTRNRLARLRTDVGFEGALDTTFGDTLSGTSGVIYDTELLPSGDVIVVGDFANAQALTTGNPIAKTQRIAKFSGTTGGPDNTFPNSPAASQFNSAVYDVEVDSYGNVLVGGSFTQYSGVNTQRFIVLTSAGAIDTSYTSGLDNDVVSIDIDGTGRVLLGGRFTKFGGNNSVYACRLVYTATPGSLYAYDPNFANPLIGPSLNSVNAIRATDVNEVMVGGTFTTVQSIARGRIARLNTDGTIDTVPSGIQSIAYLYTDITWMQIA